MFSVIRLLEPIGKTCPIGKLLLKSDLGLLTYLKPLLGAVESAVNGSYTYLSCGSTRVGIIYS